LKVVITMSEKIIQKDLDELIKKADRIFDDISRRAESRPLYEEALKIAEEEGKKLEIEQANSKLCFIDKKWEKAVKHFDEITKLKPVFSKAWHYKAFALQQLGRYKEAIECYDKALEVDPEFAYAWNNKGNSLKEMHRYEEAIECYDKALEVDPEFAYAWNNKGYALDEIRQFRKAIECYDKALEINPGYVDAWNNKGISLKEIGRYKEAIECYDKALEINPEFAYAWNNKGILHDEQDEYQKAIEFYDKALEINPEYENARMNRIFVLMHLREFDKAQEEMEKLYSEQKKRISELEIADEDREEKILEIDANKEVIDELLDKCNEILDAKKNHEKKLAKSLKPRKKPLSDDFFLVLRRWNSYTPAMFTATESNLGGGYFLHWKGKGIVIDPGFDFIDNFLNNALVIYDMDAVIITHAHIDHCSDFGSLLTLLFEYNEKNKKKKKIDVFMNLGAMKRFLGWIPLDEDKETALINRIYPLERGVNYNLEDYNLRLTVTKAVHDEVLTKAYSVGLIFELYNEGSYTKEKPFKIGYTSDTRHEDDVEEQYKGVNIIVPHLGSIDENDFMLEEEERDQNHLMLKGVISTIHKSRAKLAIISEFGEELEEHRMTIVGALDRVFRRNKMARCLTGDIGLNVSVPDLRIKCHYCQKHKDANEILEEIDPENKDKKCVIYYCKDCKGTYEYEESKTYR